MRITLCSGTMKGPASQVGKLATAAQNAPQTWCQKPESPAQIRLTTEHRKDCDDASGNATSSEVEHGLPAESVSEGL